jgi:V-type H+-transporting ATPase subunit H
MYEVALCLCLMSFSAEGRREMCARGAASVKALMSCAGAATKEKVIRACILALKNITDRHGVDGDAVGDNFTAVDESLRKLVHNLSLRGFEDEELASTLAELDEDLRARRKEASSWERYRDEVMSGSLEWSAAHKDEGFWRECATKLTDNNCQILRVLIKLIDGSEAMDPKTLAVACNDIGEFAVHYPAGRFLANDLGGKEHSMRLMSHEDDEVRKSALQCVQKLLVASWRSLSAASE